MGDIVSAFSSRKAEAVIIELKEGDPLDREAELFNAMKELLEGTPMLMREIEEYKGAQEAARRAMQDATVGNEEAAMYALMPLAVNVKHFFQAAKKLEDLFPKAVRLLSEPHHDKKHAVDVYQALARQVLRLFDFALTFDEVRMNRPILPNDFAFYRRLLGKWGKKPEFKSQLEVKEEDANNMSMFTAEHVPMMGAICRAMSQASKGAGGDALTETLAVLSNSCARMLKENRVEPNRQLMCARAMTGALVAYDHCSQLGAFHRKSLTQTKICLSILKTQFNKENQLRNSVRYTTLHFNDDSTPSSIRDLVE